MEQPYVYAYPPGAGGPSAPPPPHGGSPAGVIVDPKYCAPYPMDLAIVRKMSLTAGNFAVTDVNGNLLFNVKQPTFGIGDKRVLSDAYGTPVLTLKKKIMSLHDRWQIFRGDSRDESKLVFTVKRSSMYQLKRKLDVFLARNKDENKCDFKVKGSRFDRSCSVYVGESDTIVAQMQKKNTLQSVLLGEAKFSVTVYPNVDYAFVTALIVILDDVNREH